MVKNSKLTEKELEDFCFIGPKEIAQLVGCSIPVARQLMHSRDFPLVQCGRSLKVMKSEFYKWASEQRNYN